MSSARPPEERVLEIFHTIREAMLRNDREVLLEHVAEDYQGSDAGGRLHGKDGMVSAYGSGGVDLEALKGDLKGHHSIRVNDTWRIVFRWTGSDAHDVWLTDYH